MEINYIIGYTLAVMIGITLGLVGSGGSILSVPILVYVMNVEPILATAYSLFTVGTTALFGGIQKTKEGLVDFRKVFLFGIPTIFSVFITRKYIVPSIPPIILSNSSYTLHKSVFIMIVFAIVMIFAALKMIKPSKQDINDPIKPNYFKIITVGLLIGFTAGFVGAGGGFLLVPALLFFTKTPIKIAIGTSLFIVATQSLIGFLGDIRSDQIIDWKLLITFTSCSIVGVFIGHLISKKYSGEKLKTGFGWLVLVMGIYIITKEIF